MYFDKCKDNPEYSVIIVDSMNHNGTSKEKNCEYY